MLSYHIRQQMRFIHVDQEGHIVQLGSYRQISCLIAWGIPDLQRPRRTEKKVNRSRKP